jgi:uncharacterized protein (TIGR00369 family)
MTTPVSRTVARERAVTWEDPMPASRAAATMSGLEYLQALLDGRFPPPPIAILLGFTLREVQRGRAVFEVQPAEYHYNPIGLVHGGLAATLLDSALGSAVHSTLAAGVRYTTVDLQVHLVRAVTVDTGVLRCEASVVHAGSRLATAEGRLIDANGRVYAHGSTTCLIL